jgi:hypothetical protein
MKRTTAIDTVLFLLASPVLFALFMYRCWKHAQFLRAATTPSLECQCGRQVSLVGIWRCSCGFTYRGHLLRLCPICGRLPSMVRCYGCGITTKLPEPFHGTDN